MKNFFKIVLGSFVGTILALLIGLFLIFGIAGSILSLSESAPAVPKSAILSLNFSDPIGERSNDDPFTSISYSNLSDLKSIGLYSLINAIDAAAEDNSIKFIYMNLTDYKSGITHAEEVVAALKRFHKSGKAIVAYADNYTQLSYYIATTADKIYLNPTGMLPLSGVGITSLFFKELLDRFGVEVELVRHGKFKAAAEQLLFNKMSEENREQLQAYVNTVWHTWATQISSSRRVDLERIDFLTDNLLIGTASDALEEGLVDELLYKDEVLEKLLSLFGVEKEKDLKMVPMVNYIKSVNRPNIKEKKKVAILYAQGDIVMGRSNNNIASDTYIEQISRIRKDSTIKAVVLRVNSPGGSAQSADAIERELELLGKEKPVIVSMGDYAASGGYWIAAKGDKIYSNSTTLTGSIGVFSMIPNLQKSLKSQLHLTPQSVNSHKNSDFLSLYRALSNEERRWLQLTVEKIYDQFIELVAQGRGLSRQEVDRVAQGRVWSGEDAFGIQLVDEIGGLYNAIEGAASIAEIKSYRIVEYPIQKSGIEMVMEMLGMAKKSVQALSHPFETLNKEYSDMLSNQKALMMARVPFNLLLD
ncbi:MAG: signal peptide peptidase SppA [Bacteroidales bacterium]